MTDSREPGGTFDYRLRHGERWTRQDDGSLVVFLPDPARMIRVVSGGAVYAYFPTMIFNAALLTQFGFPPPLEGT